MIVQISQRRRAIKTFLTCALFLFWLESTNGNNVFAQSRERTEVVVIATHHFITDMPEGYTPGHLRALLSKVSPDVLAVEAASNVKEPSSIAPSELVDVIMPWAKHRRIEMVPSGWHNPGYQERVTRTIQEYTSTEKAAEYHKIERRLQEQLAAQPSTCRFMNSVAYQQIWRQYHEAISKLSEKETPWEAWNAKILRNVVKTCEAHAGKRVAVVFGGAHTYYLIDGLSNNPAINLLPAEKFFPLAEDKVASKTEPTDYLKALRPLNLNVLPPAELARLKPFLARVKEMPGFEGDYHLFRGKLLLHERKPKEALVEFEKLGTRRRDELSKFDNTTRLFETGLVFSALALYQTGDRDTARQRLENMAKDTSITPATRQLAKRLSGELP